MESSRIPKEKCQTVAAMLKILAHPQRLAILCSLVESRKTVGELEEYCGASQPAVSQHLTRMRLEGIVNHEREGNYVYYQIVNEQVLSLLESLYTIFVNAESAI